LSKLKANSNEPAWTSHLRRGLFEALVIALLISLVIYRRVEDVPPSTEA